MFQNKFELVFFTFCKFYLLKPANELRLQLLFHLKFYLSYFGSVDTYTGDKKNKENMAIIRTFF